VRPPKPRPAPDVQPAGLVASPGAVAGTGAVARVISQGASPKTGPLVAPMITLPTLLVFHPAWRP
jgi:hypothetical protein